MNRIGKQYNLNICARDVFNYGALNCPGCKFILGEVSTQCGHTAACKSRIRDAMLADKEDKHRVRQWLEAKCIHPGQKDECEHNDSDVKRKSQGDLAASTRSSRQRFSASAVGNS